MASAPGVKDLLEHIDFASCECLNEQPGHPLANALKQGYREDDGLFLASDTDEQLLINLHFSQKVRIHAITITGPEDNGPKVVKLYVNRHSMGFSDADAVPCAQQLELTPTELGGEPVLLKLTKVRAHASKPACPALPGPAVAPSRPVVTVVTVVTYCRPCPVCLPALLVLGWCDAAHAVHKRQRVVHSY